MEKSDKKIDQILKNAEKVHSYKFKEYIKNNGLEVLLKYCRPIFNVNVRKAKYTYSIALLFDENTDNDSINITINSSYRGLDIYKSCSNFSSMEDVFIEYNISLSEIKKAYENNKLVIYELWKSHFYDD